MCFNMRRARTSDYTVCNMKKYSCRVEKIMPGTEIPEEKCFSFHLGGTNVSVGWNNYTRHGNLRDFLKK